MEGSPLDELVMPLMAEPETKLAKGSGHRRLEQMTRRAVAARLASPEGMTVLARLCAEYEAEHFDGVSWR